MTSKRVNNFNAAFAKNEEAMTLDSAIELIHKYVSQFSVKFDESLDISFHTSLDQKKADNNVKIFVDLPIEHKMKRKIIFFSNTDAPKNDSIIHLSSDEEINSIAKKTFKLNGFYTAVAHRNMMQKIAKIAKNLSTKKIMPNPKFNTVIDNPEECNNILSKRVLLSVDKFGSIACAVGNVRKLSQAELKQNIVAVYNALLAAKPSTLKANFLNSVHISTTMGPAFKILTSSINIS